MIHLQYTTIGTPLPNFIYESLKEYSRDANRYRPQPDALKEKIAEMQVISKDLIYITAGADDALQMLALAYGNDVHIFPPTYIVYQDITDFYAKVSHHPSLNNGEYIISTSTIPNASMIIVANPNNPCGWTAKNDILQLVKNNPHAVVVIDEVYAEFSDLSVIGDVKDYKNLVVIRSFSKSFGMAGNRIGYVVASPEIIKIINRKAHSWANTSYLSVGAAMAALDHRAYFQGLIDDIIQRREKFAAFLGKNGYMTIPSSINAVFIQFPNDESATRMYEYLLQNDILTTHGGGENNVGVSKSFIRIAIGTEEEMTQVEKVIDVFTNTPSAS